MAVNMHLLIDGIKGESKHAKHKDEIDIYSFGFGVSQTSSFQHGGGGGSGKANFNDANFTKKVDKSSPDLFLHCCNGKHIPKAVFSMRKAGGEELEYLKITLEDILVTSVIPGGSSHSDEFMEQISFGYTRIKMEYAEQSDKGTKAATPSAGWDLSQSKKL